MPMKRNAPEVAVVLSTVRSKGPLTMEEISDETLLSITETREAISHLLRDKMIAQKGDKFRTPQGRRTFNIDKAITAKSTKHEEEEEDDMSDTTEVQTEMPLSDTAEPSEEPVAEEPPKVKKAKAKKPVAEPAEPVEKPAKPKKAKAPAAEKPAKVKIPKEPKVKVPKVSKRAGRVTALLSAPMGQPIYVVPETEKVCPKCKTAKASSMEQIEEVFGFRMIGVRLLEDGSKAEYHVPQPWCRTCRGGRIPKATTGKRAQMGKSKKAAAKA